MNNNLYRIAGWCAYLSAAATIIGAVTLAMFFSLGEPYGKINDVSSVVIGLTAIVLLFALYQLHRSTAPTISLVVFIVGALAMLTAAGLQTLLVVNGTNFGNIVTVTFGLFGVSLVTFDWLAYSNKTLPRGLAWMGIASGIGYVLVNAGFILGGENHPLTYIGGILSVIAYPTFAIWLGRVFLKLQYSKKS